MLDKKTIPYLDAGINAILYKHNYSAQKLEKHELTQLLNEPLIALSGIGNPKPFLDSVNTFCKNSPGQIRNCSLPDHYDYQKNEAHSGIYKVKTFAEKPQKETAENFFKSDGLEFI